MFEWNSKALQMRYELWYDWSDNIVALYQPFSKTNKGNILFSHFFFLQGFMDSAHKGEKYNIFKNIYICIIMKATEPSKSLS